MFELNLASLPNHILYLKDVKLSYIKVYVHIFNLWQSDKSCFISNAEFCKRTGLHKDTVINAITFFEKNGILKRVQKGKKRYLVQSTKHLEIENENQKHPVDNSDENRANNTHGSELGRQWVGVGPPHGSELDRHNNKYNNKYNKSFCALEDQKQSNNQKHEFAPMMNEAASIKENDKYKSAPIAPNVIDHMFNTIEDLKYEH